MTARNRELRRRDLYGHASHLQAVQKAKSVKPVDVAKAMSGGTFDTILGRFPIRAEDHQMVGPNFFGYIGEQDGMLRPIITITIPADVATPPPTGQEYEQSVSMVPAAIRCGRRPSRYKRKQIVRYHEIILDAAAAAGRFIHNPDHQE